MQFTLRYTKKPRPFHNTLHPLWLTLQDWTRVWSSGKSSVFINLAVLNRMPIIKWRIFTRDLARGRTKERLLPLFVKGLSKAKKFLALPHQQRLQAQAHKHNCVFLKLPFHRYDPKSSIIQSLWCSIIIEPEEKQPLYNIPNHINEPIGVTRMIVAYSRLHNIGNILSVWRFDRLIGPRVSSYGFHNQGSDC